MTMIAIDYDHLICIIESLLLNGKCEAKSSLMPLLAGTSKLEKMKTLWVQFVFMFYQCFKKQEIESSKCRVSLFEIVGKRKFISCKFGKFQQNITGNWTFPLNFIIKHSWKTVRFLRDSYLDKGSGDSFPMLEMQSLISGNCGISINFNKSFEEIGRFHLISS